MSQLNNKNDWQQIRRTKRKRPINSHPPAQPPQTEIRNRYNMLMEDESYPEASEPFQRPPIPNIYPRVLSYKDMINSITEVDEEEQFFTKSLANNFIKISSITPATYRAIIKHFKEKNINCPTYQLKEERAYRVVLKHLHHTTDTEDIKKELLELSHVVRNTINVRHRQTKEPLNLFYIDLEPAKNNKDIYSPTAIQNKIIYFEPPRTSKHHIPQCTRCQQYGHTQK